MRIFGVLFLLLVLIGGIGFYRGCFSLSSDQDDPGSRKSNVNLTVDPDKFEADADAVKEKARELTGDAKDKVSQMVQPENESSQSE